MLTDVALVLGELTVDGDEQAANSKLRPRPVKKAPIIGIEKKEDKDFFLLLNTRLRDFTNDIHLGIRWRKIKLIIGIMPLRSIKYYKPTGLQ
ncbi:hypothetical protein WKK05_03065 [Nostoc sp. UHCC 0302]|uniref:hypothetical protein n=1 Tax=Nostoc sp. UHCC 0302 TaxID=3134896 RepID=UPI00311CD009